MRPSVVALSLCIGAAICVTQAGCRGRGSSPAPATRDPSPGEIVAGSPAPDFTGTTYDGKTITLSALKGKPVVVYFYPKDETPGCTKEACSFRDAWSDLVATHAVLIGVSMDDAEAHREFVEHWKLPFLLVSDTDGVIAAKYGVPLKHFGTATFEARQTFVIGADGLVKKVYREVDVTKHVGEVVADLKG